MVMLVCFHVTSVLCRATDVCRFPKAKPCLNYCFPTVSIILRLDRLIAVAAATTLPRSDSLLPPFSTMSAPNRLLLLPAEIRTLIYSYIFVSTWIDVDFGLRAWYDNNSSRNLVISPYPEYEQSYSVLFTCHTIYAEVLPLFKRSIWIHFRDFALPTDLPRAIQRNYFCHIQVLRLSYQADIPYDLSPFVCLQELTLETEEAVKSQDVCRVLRWH